MTVHTGPMMRTPWFSYKRLALGAALSTLMLGIAIALDVFGHPEASLGARLDVELRIPDTTRRYRGLSGLAAAQHILYAVAERQRVLVPFDLAGHAIDAPLELVGLPDAVDAESLAILPDGRFVIGSEATSSGRPSDALFFAHREDTRIVVDSSFALPYSLFDLESERNRGIEGLCASNGVLVAGIEQAPEVEGRRYAPLARYDLAEKTWTTYRLALTSHSGKLSSLDCQSGPDGEIDVLAIERHYGVARLLRFRLPPEPDDIAPTIVGDLKKSLDASLNFEGVAWLADGRVALVCDNDSGGVRGESALYVVKLAE